MNKNASSAKNQIKTVDTMNKWLKIAALCSLVLLPGCLLGPDFQQPVVDTPPDFRFEALEEKAEVDLKWWELFADETLHALVEIALAENRNVLMAASRIEEARAAMGFTKADSYPRIDIEALAARADPGKLNPMLERCLYTHRLSYR